MTETISSRAATFRRVFHLDELRESSLLGANAVVSRELRVALRNERAFATLAIYVAVLGALVASRFPSDVAVGLSSNNGGAAALGYDLFRFFGISQALLIALILPALATGALSQERERRTLEPLLLTPLTPLQIVWGKAVGVLAFACLLLLATVPLTSLCFLLGGVSPGEVIGAYTCLLGLAAGVTALGLGCAAKWQNSTQATLMSYLLVPLMVSVLVIGAGPGVIAAGLQLFWFALRGVWKWWKTPHRFVKSRFVSAWNSLAFFAIPALCALALWIVATGWDYGIFWIVFVLPYLLMVAKLVIQWAADEIAKRPEARIPTPERVADWKNEWQMAVAAPDTVYLPTTTGKYSYSPQTPVAPPRKSAPATYKVAAFLPDNRNPIFMRDMRSGLLGKTNLLVRYSYVVVILSEVLAFGSSSWGIGRSLDALAAISSTHLWILMTGGAVFGARALAPEREQQTLPQLLTTPLLPREIIVGKMMTVAVYTFYLWILAVPMVLLLAAFGEIPLATVALFMALEFLFGAFAMAWGLFCSMRALTVRRALGWALGGIAALLMADSMMRTFGDSALPFSEISSIFLPGSTLQNAIEHWSNAQSLALGAAPPTLVGVAFSAAFFAIATLLLLAKTSADFRRYLQEI